MKPEMILLIAGGAYLLYISGALDSILGVGTGAANAINEAPIPGQTPNIPITAESVTAPEGSKTPQPSPQIQSPLRTLLVDAKNRNGEGDMLTFDAWNYYYAQVRGVPGPPMEDVTPAGTNRDFLYSVDEYIALMSNKGFGRMIASSQRPNAINLTGWERAGKRSIS